MSRALQVVFLITYGVLIGSLAASYYAERTLDTGMCLVGNGCLVVNASPIAHLAGVRLALVGSVWGTLLTLLVASAGTPSVVAVSRLLAGAGAFAAVLLQLYAVLGLHAFCLWCGLACLAALTMAILVLRHFKPAQTSATPWPLMAAGLMGLLPYLAIARLDTAGKTVELIAKQRAFLSTKAPSDLKRTVFVFTDFACEICYTRTPQMLREIEHQGLTPVIVPVVIKAEKGADLVAEFYYVALWRGYGRNYYERFPGPIQLQTYAEVAKDELKPTPSDMKRAREEVEHNIELFRKLGVKGTPMMARLTPGGIRISQSLEYLGSK